MNKSILVIIFLCSISAFGQNRVVIHVAAETVIEKDRIELGDIAKFDEYSPNLNRLKEITLGYAPQPGATREIPKEKIALAIAAAGFAEKEFILNCSPTILLRRAAQQINSNLLREAIENAVFAKFTDENIRAQIIEFDAPHNIQLPSGKISVRANLANVRNLFLPFAAQLEISLDERIIKRISANVQIAATADVYVAARDLSANSKIDATNDFRLENRRLEKPLQNYLRETSKLRGSVLLKNLSAGSEITTDIIAAGIAVKNGDLVRIVGQAGKLQISVTGEARASGRIGDRIAVKNSTSNVVLQAIIVDEGLVKISF